MASKEEGSDPFVHFSEEKLSEIVKASDALDQAEMKRTRKKKKEDLRRNRFAD